jgi:hypothetical protein
VNLDAAVAADSLGSYRLFPTRPCPGPSLTRNRGEQKSERYLGKKGNSVLYYCQSPDRTRPLTGSNEEKTNVADSRVRSLDFLERGCRHSGRSPNPRRCRRPSLTRNRGQQKLGAACLAKMEICAIPLAVAGLNPAVDRLPTRSNQTSPKLTSDSRAQPEMAEGIFLFESPITH